MMSKYRIGIDLLSILRIHKAYQRQPRFANRVLTPAELARFQTLQEPHCWEFLAGRFAAKEAYAKAYGTGIGRLSFQDLEVLNAASGQPEFTRHPFNGEALITIAHTAEYAVAQVLLEKEGNN